MLVDPIKTMEITLETETPIPPTTMLLKPNLYQRIHSKVIITTANLYKIPQDLKVIPS